MTTMTEPKKAKTNSPERAMQQASAKIREKIADLNAKREKRMERVKKLRGMVEHNSNPAVEEGVRATALEKDEDSWAAVKAFRELLDAQKAELAENEAAVGHLAHDARMREIDAATAEREAADAGAKKFRERRMARVDKAVAEVAELLDRLCPSLFEELAADTKELRVWSSAGDDAHRALIEACKQAGVGSKAGPLQEGTPSDVAGSVEELARIIVGKAVPK